MLSSDILIEITNFENSMILNGIENFKSKKKQNNFTIVKKIVEF